MVETKKNRQARKQAEFEARRRAIRAEDKARRKAYINSLKKDIETTPYQQHKINEKREHYERHCDREGNFIWDSWFNENWGWCLFWFLVIIFIIGIGLAGLVLAIN